MGVICYASDVMGYDRGRSELSNKPLHIKQDTTSIEKTPLNINLRLSISLTCSPLSPLHCLRKAFNPSSKANSCACSATGLCKVGWWESFNTIWDPGCERSDESPLNGNCNHALLSFKLKFAATAWSVASDSTACGATIEKRCMCVYRCILVCVWCNTY